MKVNKAVLEHLVKIAETQKNARGAKDSDKGTFVPINDWIYLINSGEDVEIKKLNMTNPSAPGAYFHLAVYRGYLFRSSSQREINDSDDLLKVSGVKEDSGFKGRISTLAERADEILKCARAQKQVNETNLSPLNEVDFIDLLNFSLENDRFKVAYLNLKRPCGYFHLVSYINRDDVFRFFTRTDRKISDL